MWKWPIFLWCHLQLDLQTWDIDFNKMQVCLHKLHCCELFQLPPVQVTDAWAIGLFLKITFTVRVYDIHVYSPQLYKHTSHSSAIEREDIIITDTFVSLLTIFVEKGALGSLKVTLITMLCIMPRGIYIYHSARCGHINIPQSHKVFERDRLARINQNMLLDLIWSHTVSSHFDLCMMQIVSCDVCTSQARTSNFSEVKVHKLSYLEHWVVEKKMTCIERTFHLITKCTFDKMTLFGIVINLWSIIIVISILLTCLLYASTIWNLNSHV
jgi:hypothetical protein